MGHQQLTHNLVLGVLKSCLFLMKCPKKISGFRVMELLGGMYLSEWRLPPRRFVLSVVLRFVPFRFVENQRGDVN